MWRFGKESTNVSGPPKTPKQISDSEENKQSAPLKPTLLDFLKEDILAVMMGLKIKKGESSATPHD